MDSLLAAEELTHMRDLIQKIPPDLCSRLVAHRGFHCTKDQLHRPLENTLPAYEQAWTAGITYCECDIFVTKDGHLMLNHDQTSTRLELIKATSAPLSSMTLPEIIARPLKSGCRPPLLSEVLGVANLLQLCGKECKLVIEIKASEETDVAGPLAKWYNANRWAMAVTGVVMSFNPSVMHSFARGLSDLGLRSEFPAPLMLLTTAQNFGVGPYQEIRFDEDNQAFSKLDKLVADPDAQLDGVYIEWFNGLTTDHAHLLKSLCERYKFIGVWQMAGCPDHAHNLRLYHDCGVRFVNTDLPRDFLTSC